MIDYMFVFTQTYNECVVFVSRKNQYKFICNNRLENVCDVTLLILGK